MPQKRLFNRFHGLLDFVPRRLGRRRGRDRSQERQSPQRYADVAETQGQSQTRESRRLSRSKSLPNLRSHATQQDDLAQLSLRGIDSSSNNQASLSSPTQSQSSYSVGYVPALPSLERGSSREERQNVPRVVIATAHARSTMEESVDDQPWMLPGQDFFPDNKGQGRRQLGAEIFDSDVFALLLEISISHSGLLGYENGLNLPLLLATLSYALDQGMTDEIEKLKGIIDRYIALRMFHTNPHPKSSRQEYEYTEYRSEEIYQAWLAVSQDERLQVYLASSDLITLYVHMVLDWWCSDFQQGWHHQFVEDIKIARGQIQGDVNDRGTRFEETFRLFFSRTGLGVHPWMEAGSTEQPTASERTSEGAVERSTGLPSRPRQYVPMLYPPVADYSGTSDNPEYIARRIRRETTVFSSPRRRSR
ncbi:hypothetical protein F53441_13458 [Fusarium austroafricanum]|uniref:Uncharacterized protein n=1 Tax=Fusarium austroafricanum TaxID=2364996 RepID=A0A8H4JQJ0_9HYPO|nr:hypothetical protein F53441_13458 [Fusarium austroafricanum]